jgi:hypothetical protein
MRYEDLRVYAGLRTVCCHCGDSFREGQVIHVAKGYDLAFCDSDSDGPNLCLQNYLFMKFWEEHPNEALLADPMVYGHRTADHGVTAPPPTLLQRFINWFDLGLRK